MHYFSNLFYNVLYIFRTCRRPSSGVFQHILHVIAASVVRMTTLADDNRTRMTNTYCVYTVLRYSWWWTVDMSEICRVFYQINLRNCASHCLSLSEFSWIYFVIFYMLWHGALFALEWQTALLLRIMNTDRCVRKRIKL
jgi:hypothetical protein